MARQDFLGWTEKDYHREIKRLQKRKKYGIVWDTEHTKEKFENDSDGKLPVLKEIKNKEVRTDKKELHNILIEGDNYHSLSVLNYTHKGAIDIIYIDPPYNTGNNDFAYNDKFVNSDDSYRHSKWLSFMQKRLILAKNVLSAQGIICISINNIELAQLKLLCDEIFNETLVGIVVWRNKAGGGKQAQDKSSKKEKKEALNTDHEYILIYAKDSSKIQKLNEILSEEEQKEYINLDNDTRGPYKLRDMEEGIPGIRENNYYAIKDPDGKTIKPKGGKYKWRFIESSFREKLKDKTIIWQKKKCKQSVDARGYVYRPMVKQYLYDVDGESRTKILRSIFYDVAYTADGTIELKQLFGEHFDKFSFPKPTQLIKKLLESYHNKNATVLDFFAGTGTTGHAVLSLNKEDGGQRRFILCTNNESNICTDVCHPRLEKVMNGYVNLEKTKIAGFGGNLKYFKTSFVESEPTDKNKKKLVDQSTEMLCLKEDCFDQVKSGKNYKIFSNVSGRYLGIVYDDEAITSFKKKVGELNKKVNTYVFSLDESAREEEFDDISDLVELKPIPQVILNVYRRIFQ